MRLETTESVGSTYYSSEADLSRWVARNVEWQGRRHRARDIS